MSALPRWGRGLATAVAATLAVATAAAPASAAPRAAAAALKLTALQFSASSVNAKSGTARVGLSWTITDAAATATAINGTVTLGVPGSAPGTFLSELVTVRFSLKGGPGVKASGTAQDSHYVYTFRVPQYAQVSPAAWQVVGMTVHDNVGNQIDLTSAQLGAFNAVLSATDLVDTTPPSYQNISIYENQSPLRPYVYVSPRTGGFMTYQFNVQDFPDGFAYGSIQVSGPSGQTITTNFSYNKSSGQCGLFSGGDPTDVQCGIPVTYPAGTAAGMWVVSQLILTDTAGNTATFGNLNAAPVTLTSNQVMRATHFRASPNPVNNWGPNEFYPVQLSMTVSGASGGVSAVYVDGQAEGGFCTQTSTVPTVSGNTVTVPLQVDSGMSLCQITGIALVDGAGDVSLYASEYGAPDPLVLIRQLPDTTPPTATSASISPTSIPSSQTGTTPVNLTAAVTTVVAPVNDLEINVYNAAGTKLLYSGDDIVTENQGTVTDQLPLPSGTPPGTYTIGFRITDAGSLSTTYGPGGDPVPGGPLKLTVTSG
jgi:hypothetical protein